MRKHQVLLQGRQLISGYAFVIQRAETGVYPIYRLTGRLKFLIKVQAAAVNFLYELIGQLNGRKAAGKGRQVGKG
jgi:hypothetical protein